MRQLKTKRGYDLFEVVSAIQKAIRRNKPKIAGWFAMEAFDSGFHNFVWKRLLTVSAEDCDGIITKEIWALYESFNMINKNSQKPKGRIFLTKAVLLLSQQPKNRDPDHFNNYVYDKGIGITDEEVNDFINGLEKEEIVHIPEYALDVHTKRGKMMGRTKEEFFKREQKALEPKQKGLFSFVVDE